MDQNVNQAPAEYAPIEEVPAGSPVKKIISFVIGLIVIVVIALVAFLIVIPRLSPKAPTDVTLTYWGIWEDTVPLSAAAAEFTRQNPHIKIKIENQDIKSLGKYIDRLQTRINNGTGPDIFRFHNSWVTELKPYLLPLPQDVVTSTSLDSKFYPTVSQDLKINGAYYGVPINFDSLALFVNVQIFQAAGKTTYPSTWDDLLSDAKQLTVKDANGKITTSGAALGTFDNIAHAPDIVSLLLVQNGADLKNLAGPSRKSAVDALDFYTSFAKGDAKVWDDTIENSTLAFAKGNLAMYIGYSWDIFEIKALNPNLQFAVVPVPHLPGRENTIASYWPEGVSSKTKHPKESFDFIKFLASKQTMETLYEQESKTRLFGELYPRTDMADLLKSNTLIYPFVAQGDKAVSTIFSGDTHDDAMVASLNQYLGNAVRSIVADNTSPDSAVDTLSAGVSQVLGRYAGK